VWSSRADAQPGRFLGDRVNSVGYPRPLNVSTSWVFAGQVSAGFFRQHHGERLVEPDGRSKDGGRLSVQGQAVLPRVKLGPISLNDLRFFARQSFYDTGDQFLTLGSGIGKEVRFGNWKLRVDRFDTYSSGSTPFLFDDVDLRHEWRPRVEYQTRGFDFMYYARLSEEGHIFDQVFEVSKLLHCIRPTLTYSVRRNEFFLEFRIPGLSGRTDRPAGQPRSSSGGDSPRQAPAPIEKMP